MRCEAKSKVIEENENVLFKKEKSLRINASIQNNIKNKNEKI